MVDGRWWMVDVDVDVDSVVYEAIRDDSGD